MQYIAILAFLYFIIPAVWGHSANVKASPRKRVWYRQRIERLRRWHTREYATAAFILTTVVFFLVGALLKTGAKLSTKFLLTVLAVNCLAALAFLYHYWDAPKIWSRYGGILKALFVPLALVVATLSKIYSDASIAELSGLVPQDLPAAQLLLTLILTPVIWLIAFSLTMGYLSLPLMPILLIRNIIQDYRKKNGKVRKPKDSEPSHITAMMAVFLCAILSLTIMERVVSKHVYVSRLSQAIAFASFHLSPTVCGLPETEGVQVAPLSDDRAALAIPDSRRAYRFELINCKPALKSDEEVRRALSEVAPRNGVSVESCPETLGRSDKLLVKGCAVAYP